MKILLELRSVIPVLSLLTTASISFAQIPILNDPELKVEEVSQLLDPADALINPVTIAFINDNDYLVVEKLSGKVRRVTNKIVQPGHVLDLDVGTIREQGLTWITRSPNFSEDNYFYLSYVLSETPGSDAEYGVENRISRFKWNGSELVDEEVVFSVPTRNAFHVGAVTVFGPPSLPPDEQKLFIGFGDQYQTTKSENNPDGIDPIGTGVILRLNQDGSIPTGADKGPFYDVAGSNPIMQAMYAYGIRNIFGLDFDPVTDNLWDTENGEAIYDEVNIVPPGFNSGWVRHMGPSSRADSLDTHPTLSSPPDYVNFGGVGTYKDPVFSWRRPNGVTSMAFINSDIYGPGYKNQLVVGAHNTWEAIDEGGKVFLFKLKENSDLALDRTEFDLIGDLEDRVHDHPISGETVGIIDDDAQVVLGKSFGAATGVTLSPDGYIYVTSYNRSKIYKISPKIASVEDWQLFQ